jgi:hypothetical protein
MSQHRTYLNKVHNVKLENSYSAAGLMALETFEFSSKFTAVSGIFKDEAFLEFLSQNANVDYVEPNHVFKVDATVPSAVIQKKASNWGLFRIHQHEKTSASDTAYPVDPNAG